VITSYKTLAGLSQAEYKEKDSRFIAFAMPVSTEQEVKECLTRLRKEYHDARHHCYAYVLLPDKSKFRASDDGEPNHSAGDPILGQLRAHDLTNTLVVVIRYFGGIKLGVGGLIHAYRSAAREALQRAQVVVRDVLCYVQLECDYPALPEVMKAVSAFEVQVLGQQFLESGCHVRMGVRVAVVQEFYAWVNVQQAMGVGVRVEEIALS
jgi:uncharacterized YigZ family protein